MNDPTFSVLTPVPLWNAAVEQLRTMIERGDIGPGAKLPAERKLCEQFGISRVSLREALRVLQATGYVETRAGLGTFARLPEVDPLGAGAVKWFEGDIQVTELFELRLLVEPGAAALAAVRRTEEDLKQIRLSIETLRRAEADGDDFAVVAADAEFHRLVGNSLHNNAVHSLVEQMQTGPERRASLSVPGQAHRALEDHSAIFEAIEAGDGDRARQEMADHLNRALIFINDYLNQTQFDNEQRNDP